MARKRNIKKHAEEHARGTLLEFDDASDEIKNLPGATPVVAWVIFQARPGGIFVRSPDFTAIKGRWSTVRGGLSIASPRPGVYCLVVVANVDGRPTTYRSEIVRVT